MAKYIQVVDGFVNGGVQTTGTPQLVEMAAAIGEGAGFTQAANVPLAAGANPTKAEFDALINSLIAAGLMASA